MEIICGYKDGEWGERIYDDGVLIKNNQMSIAPQYEIFQEIKIKNRIYIINEIHWNHSNEERMIEVGLVDKEEYDKWIDLHIELRK